MFIVKQLYDLQLLDWDIQDREQSIAEVRARLADDSKRIAAKQRVDRITARLTELSQSHPDAQQSDMVRPLPQCR